MTKTNRESSAYFQEISHYILKLRRAPLVLSSKEVDFISRWNTMRIPLSVVLEGINRSFETYTSRKAQKSRSFTLDFCEYHVMRAYDQYRDRRVGRSVKVVDRKDKLRRVEKEVRVFLKDLSRKTDFLEEIFFKAQEMIRDGIAAEEDLEEMDRQVDQLLFEKCPEAEKKDVIRKVRKLYRNRKSDELDRIFRIELVKTLRERHTIPYLSLFFY